MVWEFFKDGSPPKWHTHRLKKKKGYPPLSDLFYPRLVTRDQWGAGPILQRELDEIIPLQFPLHTLRFASTDTWECEDAEECSRLIRELQENHIHKWSYDIKWNFLIAPDGSIYEGRGWNGDPIRPEKFDYLRGHSIDIVYIGSYIAKPLYKPMKEAADILTAWALDYGKLICCYETISHKVPQVDTPGFEPIKLF